MRLSSYGVNDIIDISRYQRTYLAGTQIPQMGKKSAVATPQATILAPEGDPYN